MSNHATRHCSECGSPYQSGALRCEWCGHVLPRCDANASLARDLFAFGGRICRQKFWLMQAIISLASISLAVCAVIAFLSGNLQTVVVAAMSWIGVIAVWWMILAVWAKRWHDRGKSGLWSLILLIPMIGPIWALVELGFLKGDYGYNRYGHEDVSSSETVAKWTFWSSLAFTVVLFSVGTWGGGILFSSGTWGIWQWGIWQVVTFLLYPTVGSLIIWLMSRR